MYVTEIIYFNLLQQLVTFQVTYFFWFSTSAFTRESYINTVMSPLQSGIPTAGTHKIVYSQTSSSMKALSLIIVPSVEILHACTAWTMQQEQVPVPQEASVSLISTLDIMSCNYCLLKVVLNVDPRSPMLPGQDVLQYVHQYLLKYLYFINFPKIFPHSFICISPFTVTLSLVHNIILSTKLIPFPAHG
jgi:hypothetical protein